MPNLNTVEIKAFVPAREMAPSLAFYRALGFTVPWESPDLAYVHFGETSFLLQHFHAPGHAENFMMHLLVEDVDAWWRHVQDSGVLDLPGVRASPPQNQPWGMRDFPISDPGGVLWRIAKNISGVERA
jgi:hypothetical protein